MKKLTQIFIGIEILFYILFMTIDIKDQGYNSYSTGLKFLSILICVLFTGILTVRRQARSPWISGSFLFLILSDYFLLLSDSYEFGVCTFLCVQILFFLYLEQHRGISGGRMLRDIFVNLGAAVVAVIGMYLAKVEVDRMLIVTVIYFVRFVGNVVLAIEECSKKKEDRSGRLFALGLVLYFLCDINVGIFNLDMYLNMGNPFFHLLYQFATIAMWLFYLPGIVLITVSNIKQSRK